MATSACISPFYLRTLSPGSGDIVEVNGDMGIKEYLQ